MERRDWLQLVFCLIVGLACTSVVAGSLYREYRQALADRDLAQCQLASLSMDSDWADRQRAK
jgi:hypothetical protein